MVEWATAIPFLAGVIAGTMLKIKITKRNGTKKALKKSALRGINIDESSVPELMLEHLKSYALLHLHMHPESAVKTIVAEIELLQKISPKGAISKTGLESLAVMIEQLKKETPQPAKVTVPNSQPQTCKT